MQTSTDTRTLWPLAGWPWPTGPQPSPEPAGQPAGHRWAHLVADLTGAAWPTLPAVPGRRIRCRDETPPDDPREVERLLVSDLPTPDLALLLDVEPREARAMRDRARRRLALAAAGQT